MPRRDALLRKAGSDISALRHLIRSEINKQQSPAPAARTSNAQKLTAISFSSGTDSVGGGVVGGGVAVEVVTEGRLETVAANLLKSGGGTVLAQDGQGVVRVHALPASHFASGFRGF